MQDTWVRYLVHIYIYIYIYTHLRNQTEKKKSPNEQQKRFSTFSDVLNSHLQTVCKTHCIYTLLGINTWLWSVVFIERHWVFPACGITALWTSLCRFLSLSSESIVWATCSKWFGSGTRRVDKSHFPIALCLTALLKIWVKYQGTSVSHSSVNNWCFHVFCVNRCLLSFRMLFAFLTAGKVIHYTLIKNSLVFVKTHSNVNIYIIIIRYVASIH